MPVSKNQGFSCQEGIQTIENCKENRLKNSLFENALLKTNFLQFCSSFRSLGAPLGQFLLDFGVPGRFQIGGFPVSSFFPRSKESPRRPKKAPRDDSRWICVDFGLIFDEFWMVSGVKVVSFKTRFLDFKIGCLNFKILLSYFLLLTADFFFLIFSCLISCFSFLISYFLRLMCRILGGVSNRGKVGKG